MTVRCLVADDHPALLTAVTSFIAELGYEVSATAADGVDAVARTRETLPELAVVDYRMPRLAGAALIEQLCSASPETRVAVYTADADESVVRDSLAAGAQAVLLKESPLPDLARALAALLEGARYLDPALAGFTTGSDPATPSLTDRERSVLALLAEGLTHDEIGARLSISPETVRTHVRKACARLDASSRTHAVATALRLGLIG